VFHEADTIGSLSANGSRNELIPSVIDRVADVGVASVIVTKERSELLEFTDTFEFVR
jgi:hypothetical protein